MDDSERYAGGTAMDWAMITLMQELLQTLAAERDGVRFLATVAARLDERCSEMRALGMPAAILAEMEDLFARCVTGMMTSPPQGFHPKPRAPE